MGNENIHEDSLFVPFHRLVSINFEDNFFIKG